MWCNMFKGMHINYYVKLDMITNRVKVDMYAFKWVDAAKGEEGLCGSGVLEIRRVYQLNADLCACVH